MIVQLLLRDCDPHQNIAGARIGLLHRVGEFIDASNGNAMPLDGVNEGARLAVEFRKGLLDRDAPDDEAQLLRSGRCLQRLGARNLRRRRRAWRSRAQSFRRHLARCHHLRTGG